MSVAEEEIQAYSVGSRATVTGLNFFSMFKFSDGQIKFAGYPAESITEEQGQSLREYVKATSKELRRGSLEPAQIQRRMYWFLTKILEYGLFPSGPTFARLMAFYQASVIELDEK